MMGFWDQCAECIFDVGTSDTDSEMHLPVVPIKALGHLQESKKTKHEKACKARRREFMPLIFSVDGLLSATCSATVKHLAALSAPKWQRHCSAVCGNMRAELGVVLVRVASVCIPGSCERPLDPKKPRWLAGAAFPHFR